MRRSLVLAALVCGSATAEATPVIYDFTGTSYSAGTTGPRPFTLPLPPELIPETLGQVTFSGSVVIDHDAIDMNANGTIGYYDAVMGMSVQFAGFDFTYDALSAPQTAYTFAYVRNADNPPSLHQPDLLQFTAAGFQPAWLAGLGNGNQLAEIALIHQTFDVSEIVSDALPSSPEIFGDWGLSLVIHDGSWSQSWQIATPVQLTRRAEVSVPEPGSLALMGFGLAALALRRRVAKGARHPV